MTEPITITIDMVFKSDLTEAVCAGIPALFAARAHLLSITTEIWPGLIGSASESGQV